ncbi:MAG: FAD-dependent oxidoreductase, partial [Oscillospiraceae bacterium]|nr:FAD-dependent oxidoreductase [Oscillospiraceae bacterium]
MKEYDVAVVGGGVTGALTLRELVSRGLRCCLFEAGNDLASGASRANSAIIHAGFDPLPGTLKARLNVRGAALYPALVKALDVPYQPIPTLVAARSEAELTTVEALLDRGLQNGVPGLEKLDAAALREAEPNVSDDAVGALRAPSAIVEPWTVAVAAAENAADNGADVYLGSPVVAVEPAQTGYRLTARRRDGDFSVRADAVVNASGVRCAELHAMVAAPSFRITGRRGQYFVLDRGAAGLVRNVLFPCPTEKGKGMLIFPEIHGRVMLGPDSELTADPTDTATEAGALAVVRATVSRYLRVPLPFGLTIRTFAGVRAVGDRGDFILEEADGAPGFFDAAGIESPG